MQFLNVQLSFVGGLKRQKIATCVTILWEHLLQGHVLWFARTTNQIMRLRRDSSAVGVVVVQK